MKNFKYKGRDILGRLKEGEITLLNEYEVRMFLKDNGLLPLEVVELDSSGSKEDAKGEEEDKEKNKGRRRGGRKGRGELKDDEILLFTEKLSFLVDSGVGLYSSIKVMKKEEGFRKREYIRKILKKLEEGDSFSKTLGKLSLGFSSGYINLIEVGEYTGTLEKVLKVLRKDLVKKRSRRKKLINTLIYPSIVLFLVLVLMTFLIVVIIPNFVKTFGIEYSDLPSITRGVLTLGDIVKSYGVWMVVSLGAIWGVIKKAMRYKGVKIVVEKSILSIPKLKNIIRERVEVDILSELTILYTSGVTIEKSIRIVEDNFPWITYKDKLSNIVKTLEKGHSIEESLRESGIFSNITLELLSIGEQGGKLEDILMEATRYRQEILEEKLKNVEALIEPITILIVGAIVGIVVSSMYLPIFEVVDKI